MSLFVDKNNRRKSPIAIAAFFAAAGDLCVFLILYALLAEPLYRYVALPGQTATNVLHTLIVAVIGTAVCCLLFLLPDKGVALLYLIFLGLYPVVKNNIEGLRRLPLEWLCKLACFNAALSLFWFALRALFLPDPPVWLGERTWLLYLAGNLIFVLYDVGLSRLIALVMARMPGRRR